MRRQSSVQPSRTLARDVPKTIELEQRVARIEISIRDLQDAVSALSHRLTALQAHVDHLVAKVRF